MTHWSTGASSYVKRVPHETKYGHKKKVCLEQNISIGSHCNNNNNNNNNLFFHLCCTFVTNCLVLIGCLKLRKKWSLGIRQKSVPLGDCPVQPVDTTSILMQFSISTFNS